MVRIVLVDSHRLFRVSLKSLISSFSKCEVVLDVSSVKEIPKGYDTKAVHLVIFDPVTSEKMTVQKVQKFFSSSRMMILTDDMHRDSIMSFMKLRISGLFSKDDCPSQLETAIHDASNNYDLKEIRLGSVVRQTLVNDAANPQKKKVDFTDREIQILRLVCIEKTNAEISDLLGLSIRTIESHRRRMIDKADCRSIIGVILNALELKSVNLDLPIKAKHKAS